jgi:serine/threonine-protein phosphatase 2A regulatory subunit B
VPLEFLAVKIWNVCNTKKRVNEALTSKLCDMIGNECILDKFSPTIHPDDNTIVSGNYNNSFHLIDFDGSNTQY